MKAKAGAGSATLSMAYAAARFTDSLIKGKKSISYLSRLGLAIRAIFGPILDQESESAIQIVS